MDKKSQPLLCWYLKIAHHHLDGIHHQEIDLVVGEWEGVDPHRGNLKLSLPNYSGNSLRSEQYLKFAIGFDDVLLRVDVLLRDVIEIGDRHHLHVLGLVLAHLIAVQVEIIAATVVLLHLRHAKGDRRSSLLSHGRCTSSTFFFLSLNLVLVIHLQIFFCPCCWWCSQ